MNEAEWNRISPLFVRGAEYRETDGVGAYTLPLFSAAPWIGHGFSSRIGGVSTGCYASLNLSFTRPDDPELVRQNYRIFARAMGFDTEAMVMDSFAHGTTVRRVGRADMGSGWSKEPLPSCDGLITDEPGVVLVTGHADCNAYYCCDAAHHAVGLAHAGWRGTLNRMGTRLVDAMREAFGSDPGELIVGISPSIGFECFEVGTDVADRFEAAFPGLPCRREGAPGKAYIDLWSVAACQFVEAGVRPGHINIAAVCTSCERERLYSHRRDHGETGGMAAYLTVL